MISEAKPGDLVTHSSGRRWEVSLVGADAVMLYSFGINKRVPRSKFRSEYTLATLGLEVLASALYWAHETFLRDNKLGHAMRPRWFALREECKEPYIEFAKKLLEEEGAGDDVNRGH